MKKKVLALTMSLMMALSFAACGSQPNEESSSSSEQQSSSAEESSSTEESSSAADASTSDQAYATLQDWMESDEAALTIETTNQVIASTGMTLDLSADGNVFVYEYYVSDDLGLSALSEEQLAASLDPVVEANKDSVTTLFDNFESGYGLVLDGVRFTFFTEDGTELYSADIANE